MTRERVPAAEHVVLPLLFFIHVVATTKAIPQEGGDKVYGAVLGDICGMEYEGAFLESVPYDPKDIPLLGNGKNYRMDFTDDTVLTTAVAEATLELDESGDLHNYSRAFEVFEGSLRRWGRKYSMAGYGPRFLSWLASDHPAPYDSCGNGSAMRASATGWAADSLESALALAKASADPTHNHPEGVKGAQCTAAVVFLAKRGYDKDAIESFVKSQFGYPTRTPFKKLRGATVAKEGPVTCQDSLPKALSCFFLCGSLEDTVRRAVWLGGDTDTVAAIAGSMAEAFYGVPEDLVEQLRGRLALPYRSGDREDCFLEVADRFYARFGHRVDHSDPQAPQGPVELPPHSVDKQEGAGAVQSERKQPSAAKPGLLTRILRSLAK